MKWGLNMCKQGQHDFQTAQQTVKCFSFNVPVVVKICVDCGFVDKVGLA